MRVACCQSSQRMRLFFPFLLATVLLVACSDSTEAVQDRCAPFPDRECETLWRVELCESNNGLDPDTYSLDAPNGGRLQINKGTWAGYFWLHYGWTWEQIVLDDHTNRVAGFIIWERNSGWTPWECY